MTDVGFTFSTAEQTSTIPTKKVEVAINHLVVDRADAVANMTATIDLVTTGGPVYDDVGALIAGFPLTESAADVNKVVSFPLRATTDSLGAGDHLFSLEGDAVHYELTVKATVDGRLVTLIDKLPFDVDTQDDSPIPFTGLAGPLAPFIPSMSPAAKTTVDAYIAQLLATTRTGATGPQGIQGPQGVDGFGVWLVTQTPWIEWHGLGATSWYSAKDRPMVSARQAAAPTGGTYAVGDRVYNAAPVAGGTVGWVCVTAGTPGTWKTFGDIQA